MFHSKVLLNKNKVFPNNNSVITLTNVYMYIYININIYISIYIYKSIYISIYIYKSIYIKWYWYITSRQLEEILLIA